MTVLSILVTIMVVDHLHVAPGDGEGVIITPVLVGVTNGGKVEEDGVIDTKEKQIINSGSNHPIMDLPTCSCC